MKERKESEDSRPYALHKILIVLFAGLFLIILGVAMVVIAAALGGGSTSAGIVIFIGPIPIIIGTGPEAQWMILLAVILTILGLALFLVLQKKTEELTV